MTSSTLSKLLCAIICNNHFSELAPPADPPGPATTPRFPPIVLAGLGSGGVISFPLIPVNVDQEGNEDVEEFVEA